MFLSLPLNIENDIKANYSYLQVAWKNPKGIMYRKVELKRRKYHYGMHRPWTQEFKLENGPGQYRRKVFVEPHGEWAFFK